MKDTEFTRTLYLYKLGGCRFKKSEGQTDETMEFET